MNNKYIIHKSCVIVVFTEETFTSYLPSDVAFSPE